jgi:hypothetical protein
MPPVPSADLQEGAYHTPARGRATQRTHRPRRGLPPGWRAVGLPMGCHTASSA